MKRALVAVAVCLVAWLAPAAARAGKLTVDVRDDGTARLVLDLSADEIAAFSACGVAVDPTKKERVVELTYAQSADEWLRLIEQPTCKKAGVGAQLSVVWTVPGAGKVIQSREAVLGLGHVWRWLEGPYGSGLARELGAPKACSFDVDGTASTCTVVQGPDRKLLLTRSPSATGTPTSATIEFEHAKVKVDVLACTTKVTPNPLRGLVAGATEQRIDLAVERPECLSLLEERAPGTFEARGREVRLVSDKTEIEAFAHHDASGAWLQLLEIPTQLPQDRNDWTVTLRDPDVPALRFELATLSAATVTGPTTHFPDPRGPTAPKTKTFGDGSASVHPLPRGDKYPGDRVINVSQIALPTTLTSPVEAQMAAKQDREPRSVLSWRIQSPTWAETDLAFSGLPPAEKNGAQPPVTTPTQIEFVTYREETTPLVASLQLVQSDGSGPVRVLVSLPLELAKSAKARKLRLPASDALFAWCKGMADDADAKDGDVRAIPDGAVRDGRCFVGLDFDRIDAFAGEDSRPENQEKLAPLAERNRSAALRARFKRLAPLYGAQALHVSIEREGATAKTAEWVIPAFTAGRIVYLSLPAPDNDDKGKGPYKLTIDVVTKDSFDEDPAAAAPPDSDFTFHAGLNSRGPFGWPAAIPIRTFVTIPIELVAARFPAAPRDLKLSSHSPSYDILTMRTGVLLAFEPWNYDLDRNITPVGLRFVGGLHMLQANDPNLSLSVVNGVSLGLPVFKQDQLETTASIAAYWEVDLRDGLRHGNHFLLGLGFNVLSLFGAPKGPGGG